MGLGPRTVRTTYLWSIPGAALVLALAGCAQTSVTAKVINCEMLRESIEVPREALTNPPSMYTCDDVRCVSDGSYATTIIVNNSEQVPRLVSIQGGPTVTATPGDSIHEGLVFSGPGLTCPAPEDYEDVEVVLLSE